MGYAQYVGRVGALAVALGIGVAVANGGVASATTDPDPDPGAAQGGEQNPETPTPGDPGAGTPQNPDGPETPPVAIDGVVQEGNESATTQRRIKPRVMILDILRGANVLGARRPADQDPVKQPSGNEDEQEEQQTLDLTGGSVAKSVAPVGSSPINQVVVVPRALQRTIAAITAPPQPKIAPSAKVLPGVVKPAAVFDTLTSQAQRQAATITGPSTLAEPLPPPPPARPSPVRFVLNLLSAVGLRPEAFPPGSPLAPLGQLLEFVYAGLRRVDHQLFNQAPQESVLVQEPDKVTGVINGRVAYDYDDELEFTLAPGEEPEHGTVAFNPDGTFVYTPNLDDPIPAGTTDSFTVQITEATTDHAHLDGAPHTLTVEVANFEVAPHDSVIATIGVGDGPSFLAITPDGSRVYVTNQNSHTVSVINTATNTVVGLPITVGDDPSDIAISPDGTRVYVVNKGDSTVSIIDSDPASGTYNTVIATSDVLGADPHTDFINSIQIEDVAINPSNGYAYVTTFNGFTVVNNVWVIDPDTGDLITSFYVDGDATDPADADLGDIEIDQARPYAYIADITGQKVLVVDLTTNTVVKSVTGLGQTPQEMILSPDGNTLYVNHNVAGTISVIDVSDPLNPSVVTIDDGIIPGLFEELGVGGGRAYVNQPMPILSDPTDDVVMVIDLSDNSFVRNIPVGANPWDVTVSPDGTRVYVTNIEDDTISVIAVLLPPATVV